MKATRMTSKESGVKLVRSRSEPEYLFEDMPPPTPAKAPNPFDVMQEFVAVSSEVGGLLRPVDAAKVLGIVYGTIQGYLQHANPPFEVFEYFGVKWISGRSIRARLDNTPSRGRPRVSKVKARS
jgi:hypothetical protein